MKAISKKGENKEKTVLLKVAFAALLVWGLFAQPVTAEENIHFSSCREAWEMVILIFIEENQVTLQN